MEKEIRTFDIDYLLGWEYTVEINKIRADLDAIEKLGATHINFEANISYDIPYLDISAISKRIETDEEHKYRIDEIIKQREETKGRELAQLERLKLKYGL